jgi:hypothetical protein
VCLQRQFHKLHLSKHVNNLYLYSQLANLANELDDKLPAPLDIDEVRQLLQDTQKMVHTLTIAAAELWVKYLEEQPNNLDGNNNKRQH